MGVVSRPLARCWSSHAKCPRVPMCKRAAIQAKGIVVLDRNSRANWTFPRSPLPRALDPCLSRPRLACPFHQAQLVGQPPHLCEWRTSA